MRHYFAILILFVALAARLDATTFSNPVISTGADPWVVFKDGSYYYTHTTGGNVTVRKSTTLTGNTGLGNASAITVFTPATPNNKNVWAPELHFLHGKWYVYFAADDGNNANHRMYVAEASTSNPQGAYTSKGKITDATDRWAIDGTVLEKDDGSLFFIWSGWPGSVDGEQNLYIAPMSNPWTISGPRVLISTPTHSWESWINEGPQIIKRNGKIFIVYSANRSWTDEYCFGLLTNTDGNVLNPASWTKHPVPIFKKYIDSDGSVFGPGHGSFTKSIDQKEDWLIYHAAKYSGSGWNRNVRLQKFTWNANDSPNFGNPFPTNIALNVPSGEGNNSINVTWTSGGFVARRPNQISYPQNATVTLTATPAFGNFFIGWQGDASGSTNPLDVTMDANKLIIATFTNDLILDNSSAVFSGNWSTGTTAATKFGSDYRFAHISNSVTHTATYVPNIPATAKYDVYVWYPEGANRTVAAPHLISHLNGATTTNINQQSGGGGWRLLAAGKQFAQGTNGFIQISNSGSDLDKVVMADAIRLVFSTNQDLPPNITTQPNGVSVPRGSNATFAATASGTAPLYFQWRFNGTNIANATTNVLFRENVQGDDAGIYSLIVSNHEGLAVSSNAVLAVQLPLEFQSAGVDEKGELHLLVTGTFGTTNTIETSPDLVNWFELTNLVFTNSEMELIGSSTNSPQRFFRLMESD